MSFFSCQWLEPVHETVIFEMNDIVHQLHHLFCYRSRSLKIPILKTATVATFLLVWAVNISSAVNNSSAVMGLSWIGIPIIGAA